MSENKVQETQQPKSHQKRLSKFVTEEERRASLLKSKRDYYRRNNELYKLKTLERYFQKQLQKYSAIEGEKAELVLIQKNRRKQTDIKEPLHQPIETTELKN